MNVPAASAVAVEIWQLFTAVGSIAVFCIGGGWTFAKLVLHNLDKRFEERDKQSDALAVKVETVTRDLARLREQLPSDYMRREDWIRFCVGLDQKLDSLHATGTETRVLVEQALTKLNSGSVTNDR